MDATRPPTTWTCGTRRRCCSRGHYGLKKAKERILEYIAVRSLAAEKQRQPILCFVGPPGTGKTSLGKSIAEALGRKFVRMSLGGIRDEAEIRGHRRTYIGALPGRILQAMRRAGTVNPLFMLDEIDKLGHDFRGDPAAALLEVLDPEQNNAFSDHYLEIAYDLSRVLFITTANTLTTIPPALLDRLEVIDFPGYIEEEKLVIARQFLIPRQLEQNGLPAHRADAQREGRVRAIIRDYTWEAGRPQPGARDRQDLPQGRPAQGGRQGRPARTSRRPMLARLLGPPEIMPREAENARIRSARPSVWRGPRTAARRWRSKCCWSRGRGTLQITGQVGEVMQESAQAALSYIKSRARDLGVEPEIVREDRHPHSRSRRSHPQGRSERRDHHGHGPGLGARRGGRSGTMSA